MLLHIEQSYYEVSSIIVAEASDSVVCNDIGAIGQIVIISPQHACASGL